MFGLDDRHLDFVLSVLKRNISDVDAKFYIFGSRVKGTNKKYSDIESWAVAKRFWENLILFADILKIYLSAMTLCAILCPGTV